MRGDPGSMTVLRPATVREAFRYFERAPDAIPLAGGTDFMVAWNAGEANRRTVLDLSRLRSWRRIRERPSGVVLGALATHWELQSHPVIASAFPLLAAACRSVGGRQIQTRGTLGGNIANASPAGDTFPPLAVYQARVRLRSAGKTRLVPFLDVFAGVKKTTLARGELIESVEIDFHPRATRQLFRKVGTRAASAISKVVASGLLWLSRDGRVREARFALGSMAETVRRLEAAEAFLAGKRLDARVVEEAVALLEKDVSPIDDLRSTREYRLSVSGNLFRDFLSQRGSSGRATMTPLRSGLRSR
jgi:CO/xanthine dehydrogenase FAD-binding subunit